MKFLLVLLIASVAAVATVRAQVTAACQSQLYARSKCMVDCFTTACADIPAGDSSLMDTYKPCIDPCAGPQVATLNFENKKACYWRPAFKSCNAGCRARIPAVPKECKLSVCQCMNAQIRAGTCPGATEKDCVNSWAKYIG